MAITNMYLDDQAGTILQIIPNPNIIVTQFAPGFPDIRAVTEPRPQTDGERDTTALIGGRAVSLAAGLWNTPAATSDLWLWFMAPGKRSYLYVTDTEWTPNQRRIPLRADSYSGVVVEGADDVYRGITAQWRAPTGVWEAINETMVTVTPYSASSSGFSLPSAMPMQWATTTAYSDALITNNGPLPVHFKVNLYGLADGPALYNDTTQSQMNFVAGQGGLQIAQGSYVELDTRERTANLLSDPSISRLPFLAFATSFWWALVPGVNKVRYVPSAAGQGSSTGASAVITYRQTYL